MEFQKGFEEGSTEFYEKLLECEIYDAQSVRELQGERARRLQDVCSEESTIKDYMDFIVSERKLRKFVELREKNLDTATVDDKNAKYQELKDYLYKCIYMLYLEALIKDPSFELWESFLSYVKKKRPQDAEKYYEQMLDKNSQKDEFWAATSVLHYHFHHNIEKFEDIIKRGLTINPTSKKLYITQFQIALEQADADYGRICEGDLNLADQFEESLRRVDRIYKEAKENILDFHFKISLLQRVTDDKFQKIAPPILSIIIEDIAVNYRHLEEMWCHLALREFSNFNNCDLLDVFAEGDEDRIGTWMNKVRMHYAPEFQETIKDQNSNQIVELPSIWVRRPPEILLYLCYKVLEVGTRTLLTRKMSNAFINTMMEFHSTDDVDVDTRFKRKYLVKTFQLCHQKNLMSEKHYCIFLRLLLQSENGENFAQEILEDDTKNWKSLAIFTLWISVYIGKDYPHGVEKVYAKACKVLGSNSLDIFDMAILYFKTRYDEDKATLKKIYKHAISVNSPAFGKYRVQYLDFCAINMSPEKMRLEYDEMAQLLPPCLEMHRKMEEIEISAHFKSVNYIAFRRKVYENMVTQFGEKDSSIWLDYIKFEKVEGDPLRVLPLYQRAKNNLNERESIEFQKEYILQIEEQKHD